MSPEVLGVQLTQKTLVCSPSEGSLQPFQKIPVQFQCETQISEEQLQAVQDFPATRHVHKIRTQEINYTVMIEFEG